MLNMPMIGFGEYQTPYGKIILGFDMEVDNETHRGEAVYTMRVETAASNWALEQAAESFNAPNINGEVAFKAPYFLAYDEHDAYLPKEHDLVREMFLMLGRKILKRAWEYTDEYDDDKTDLGGYIEETLGCDLEVD